MTDIDLHQLSDRIRAHATEGVHPSRGPLISVAAVLTLIEGAAGIPVGSLAAPRRWEQWVVKAGPETVVGTFFDQATAEQWRDRVREHQHPDAYIEHEPGDGSSDDGQLPEPTGPDDAHTETVTEWRVTATTPKGERVEFWHRAERPALDQAAHYRRWAWSDVRVESRTVTTSRRESEWKATDQ